MGSVGRLENKVDMVRSIRPRSVPAGVWPPEGDELGQEVSPKATVNEIFTESVLLPKFSSHNFPGNFVYESRLPLIDA